MSEKGYGKALSAEEIGHLLDEVLKEVNSQKDKGHLIQPICIWGKPGIGKTQIVMDIARRKGWGFSYCAPAQFEEMGDFHGIPVVENGRTVYNIPKWVPQVTGQPGILLLDDFNRSDDRILRGLMQLLQHHGLMSWKLPSNWFIVCTANPEGDEYSVTTLDSAMLTRMMHVTLKFDPKEWARWALKHDVDLRGVDFVLTYPEIANGYRTNPRSLTTFFHHIKGIKNLSEEVERVHTMAMALLDEETVSAFMVFIDNELNALVSPEELLEAKSFELIQDRIKSAILRDKKPRLDTLFTICTRLIIHLENTKAVKRNYANIVSFLLMPEIPNDMRVSMQIQLNKLDIPDLKKKMLDPKLVKMILE
jgi:MoxR-like ATPase